VVVVTEKKSKNLDKKLKELTRENQSLKKKIGKLRKDVSISQDALISNQEYASQIIHEEKKEKMPKCEHCGGETKRFKIHNLLLDICQACKSRKKVEKVEADKK
jgi:hypothetical protein